MRRDDSVRGWLTRTEAGPVSVFLCEWSPLTTDKEKYFLNRLFVNDLRTEPTYAYRHKFSIPRREAINSAFSPPLTNNLEAHLGRIFQVYQLPPRLDLER
jgi:hypothetical protein